MAANGKVFITGYAKFPSNVTGSNVYEEIGVGLIVASDTGVIVDADCSLVTRTGKNFFTEVVKGCNILEIDKIINHFKNKYYGHAQKAIIAALKSAHRQYRSKIE